MRHTKESHSLQDMEVEPNIEHEAHPAASLDENQLIDNEEVDAVSVMFPIMKAEVWHNLEAMKVEPDANHETNLAPSFEENQFIEMKEKGYPISITFPVINAEIQQEELWDFTTIRDEVTEEKYEDHVYSLEELGVPQEEFINSSKSQLNMNSQRESDGNIDNEGSKSYCVPVGQEPYKWKLRQRRSYTGERPFKSDMHSKCSSEKANLAVQSSGHRGKKAYNCEFCTKVFSCNRSLLQHRCIHTDKTAFKCDICDERFFEKETLAVHVLVHSGTLSYSHWRKAIEM